MTYIISVGGMLMVAGLSRWLAWKRYELWIEKLGQIQPLSNLISATLLNYTMMFGFPIIGFMSIYAVPENPPLFMAVCVIASIGMLFTLYNRRWLHKRINLVHATIYFMCQDMSFNDALYKAEAYFLAERQFRGTGTLVRGDVPDGPDFIYIKEVMEAAEKIYHRKNPSK